MKTYKYDVAIVGGGLAGLTAAERLAEKGLGILVLDDSDQLGGQILRRPPDNMVIPVVTGNERLKENGVRLIDKIRKGKTDVRINHTVLGVFPGPELLVQDNQGALMVVSPRTVLFATGARERFLPFKGWTLPGVISTGALQLLIKKSGMLPAEKVMVGGAGLFPLAAAYNAIANGGKVQSVVDRNGLMAKAAVIKQLPAQLDKVVEGFRYLSRILLSQTPILHNTRIVEARGDRRLEKVVTARVDKLGRKIPGSEKTHPVELLAVGYGFAPNIQLPQLAGCGLEYDMLKGGWAARVNSDLETSVENIFAAGETTGVAGALKSITEGELAALSILERLDAVNPAQVAGEKERLKRDRKRHMDFGAFFNSATPVKLALLADLADGIL